MNRRALLLAFTLFALPACSSEEQKDPPPAVDASASGEEQKDPPPAAGASASGSGSGAPAGQPAPAASATTRIDLEVEKVALEDVMEQVSRQVNHPIVVDPALASRPVTVDLRDIPWREAVELIARMNGARVEEDGGTLKVVPN